MGTVTSSGRQPTTFADQFKALNQVKLCVMMPINDNYLSQTMALQTHRLIKESITKRIEVRQFGSNVLARSFRGYKNSALLTEWLKS